jgi:hypothetical protein
MRPVARRLLPFLATAGVVVEADRIIDVQILAWPLLAAVAICAAAAVWGRRENRA